jgi:hypothetical protein
MISSPRERERGKDISAAPQVIFLQWFIVEKYFANLFPELAKWQSTLTAL